MSGGRHIRQVLSSDEPAADLVVYDGILTPTELDDAIGECADCVFEGIGEDTAQGVMCPEHVQALEAVLSLPMPVDPCDAPLKPIVVGWVSGETFSHLVVRLNGGNEETLVCGREGQTWPNPKPTPDKLKCKGCDRWLRRVESWAPIVWRKAEAWRRRKAKQ